MLSSCTKKIVKLDPKEVSTLKEEINRPNTQIVEFSQDKNKLQEELDECNSDYLESEFEVMGVVIDSQQIKSSIDGSNLFGYTIRAFQSDSLYSVVSSEKIDFKGNSFIFVYNYKNELLRYELYD